MRLILCRHGETDHNRKGIIQGRKDTELNQRGREQGRKLAERLKDIEIDHIYSSPLKRAFETGEIVAEKRGLEVESHEGFKEMSRGVLEGETHEKRDEELEKHDGEVHKWKPENGENFPEVSERALKALEELKREHKGENILITAHGHLNRSLIFGALGYDTTHAFKLEQGNVCINELSWEEGKGWIVERLNDTAHLE